MTAVIFTAARIALLIATIGIGIALAYCAAWQLVYVAFRCKHNPIGKSALVGSAILWLASSAVINLL
jgi:hypothetical protein